MSAALRSAEEIADSVRMIRDSAAAVVPEDGALTRIRGLRFSKLGFDPAVWRQMGELGWIGLRIPEDRGGSGLGMVESCALAEELGRGLVPEPLIAGWLSVSLLDAAGEEKTLAALLAGEIHVATAWQDAADTLHCAATDAPRLFVPAAMGAAAFLLPHTAGDEVALRLIPADQATLEVQRLQDGGHVATLRADADAGRALQGRFAAALARALDEAALATAAMMLGVMERAFALSLDYLRQREQFGRKLGSFQVLQHRAADLKIQISLTRASVEAAAATLDSGAPGQAAVSRAKARAAEAGMLVTRQAVQLHGAIGYTDEADIGLFLRKAMVLANQFGSAARHRARFMAVSPEEQE